MTDEEKGIETSRRISMACLSITSIQYCSMVKQAYLEGLAEGRKESNLIIQEGVKSNCRLQDKIEQLEKENEELKVKLSRINNYLANDIPLEFINEATDMIWRII